MGLIWRAAFFNWQVMGLAVTVVLVMLAAPVADSCCPATIGKAAAPRSGLNGPIMVR